MARKKADPPKAKSSDELVLERAKERFKSWMDRDQKNRDAQAADTRFVYEPGAQWPKETRDKRKGWKYPCMEFPQLKQFVNQVINDQRQGRPGVRIHPASGDASKEVAEILQGLIRNIEYDSGAEAVYDCGYQHSVVGGRGYWRIVSEYESADSFNQKLVIKRIPDPLSVLLDPDYKEPDGGDRSGGFVFEAVAKTEFKRLYPNANPLSYDEDVKDWYPTDDEVILADYYERVAVKRNLVRLSDGTVGWEDEVSMVDAMGQPLTVADTEERDDYKVDWYTIAGGQQVLAKHEWPGKIVPVVCTMGDEIIVAGERLYQGLIAQAKDAQALFNYGMTEQAVHLSLTPRAPYIAAVGQIEGLEGIWNEANERNYSVIPYHPQVEGETLVPPPQRQPPTTPDSGWINWTQQMTMLMRSTIGMYENSLSMKSSETSGRAIIAKEQQGDNATFHYMDNFSRAIALTGRICVEVIPTYYDTQRVVQITLPDDTRKSETINQQIPGSLEAIKKNDLSVGKFAVVIEAGPTYKTKRQESADRLGEMVKAFPPLMQVAGDLIFKAQDMPDSDQLSDRAKFLLLPAVQQSLAADEQEGQQVPAQVRVQMGQMQQAIQQLQQQLQQAMAANKDLQDDNDTKILMKAMDNATKILTDLNQPQDPMAIPMGGPQVPGAPGGGMVIVPPPPRPSAADMLSELPAVMQQIVQMGQQLAAAVSAPRQVSLQTDPMGNPVGAVSAPMQ